MGLFSRRIFQHIYFSHCFIEVLFTGHLLKPHPTFSAYHIKKTCCPFPKQLSKRKHTTAHLLSTSAQNCFSLSAFQPLILRPQPSTWSINLSICPIVFSFLKATVNLLNCCMEFLYYWLINSSVIGIRQSILYIISSCASNHTQRMVCFAEKSALGIVTISYL